MLSSRMFKGKTKHPRQFTTLLSRELFMQIRKAVITAAAQDQTHLPLQTVVDQSGHSRNAIELILDEVVAAGIDDIGVVVCPGQADRYLAAAGPHASRLTFLTQENPKGYGDAILRAEAFTAGQPFLHLVGDHLYVSRDPEKGCVAQLLEIAQREECCVSAIQPTRESKLRYYGAIGGTPVPRHPGLYEVTTVVEKPTPTTAEQQLVVAGQRSGYYLCLFGMHVLTPAIMQLLKSAVDSFQVGRSINLTDSLNQLVKTERFLAFQVRGERYNIGEKYGLLIAQMAIALSGPDRDRILVETMELLARD